MPLFILLVAVPIIEIALFIKVGGWLGLWPTIAIVILTAILGTMLLRAQGLAALGELQRQLHAGEDPSSTLAHGAMILVAGILLLTPGFFTDAIGFLLLTPPVRAAALRFIRARVTVAQAGASGARAGMHWRHGPGAGDTPGTVDGEYEVVDPDSGDGDGSDDQAGNRTDGAANGSSGWTRVPKSGAPGTD